MFFVVCFDVSDDKKRYRVVKKLKGHCIRVQKSVFECPELTEKQFLKLKAELEKVIDEATDTVRYYRLCKGCISEVEVSGQGEPPDDSNFLAI
ncbi:CRISPR-associated protein Cas2 [Dissulfuribacter thermophilus]|uniref:CRISPR-associated endoribonuclease Cas2 n=1 Tax=Dissulfuribacter thermophilus TaxID=1156395 RepID=A0A1B9F4V2_9BACT|nr:CRISPR-associated protein Cas2 [Dissulfuribacter thermophilus]